VGDFFLSVNVFINCLSVTAIWKFQSLHGALPEDISHVDELETISNTLISEADVNSQVLTKEPRQLLE
jgi:ubiquitin-like 1-activating enzyme E1 A